MSAGRASWRASTSSSSPSISSASMNTTWTAWRFLRWRRAREIHLRVTRSMTANTACFGQPAKWVHVVDADRVAAVLGPLRERLALRPDASGALQNKTVSSRNAADSRRRDPHRVGVAATVRELAMRTIDIAPARTARGSLHLLGSQTMQRGARLAVIQTAGIAAAAPPHAALVQLEIDAGATVLQP